MLRTLTAAALFAVAVAACPAHADVAEIVARCERLQAPEDARAAVTACTEALQTGLISEKVRVNMLVNRGSAHRILGNFEQAEEDLTNALALGGPRAFEAWYGRGLVRSGMGQLDKAIVDFNRALELNRRNPSVFVGRGNAYAARGDYARAVEDYTSAINIDPGYADAWYARGTAHNRLGNAEQAIADYERAIEEGGDGTVVALQSYLKADGHYEGELDGVYGPATRRALRACVDDPGC